MREFAEMASKAGITTEEASAALACLSGRGPMDAHYNLGQVKRVVIEIEDGNEVVVSDAHVELDIIQETLSNEEVVIRRTLINEERRVKVIGTEVEKISKEELERLIRKD